MQQTEKYKLNLIESSDPFLPDALNANTQKIEEVVSGHLEAMDQRVTVLEGFHFTCGFYTGTGEVSQTISLPFTPRVVIVANGGRFDSDYGGISVRAGNGENKQIKLKENGFDAKGGCNFRGSPFSYIAFA